MSDEAYYLNLVGKLLSGDISGEERKQLLDWADARPEHAALLADMTNVWDLAGACEPEETVSDPQKAWQRLEAVLDAPGGDSAAGEVSPRQRMIRPGPGRWWALAAAVALLLTVLWQWSPMRTGDSDQGGWVEAVAAYGERKELVLPDGSRIWLNAGSRLLYDRQFTRRRNVRLEGEAFFEVQPMKGLPFTVETGAVKTVVLGTSFNVRAYPEEEVVVSVRTGVVRLEAGSRAKRREIVLNAGSSGLFVPEASELRMLEQPEVRPETWREGRLQFDGASMAEIARVLERYFNISVRILDKSLEGCTFYGAFEHPVQEEVFDVLAFAMHLDVQIRGDTVELSGEGCE